MTRAWALAIETTPRWMLAGIVGAAAIATIAPFGALATVLILLVACGIALAPRIALPVLAIVLVLQEALARNVSGIDDRLPTIVRSLDEVALMAGAARVLWMSRSITRWLRARDWALPGMFLASGILSSVLNWRGIEVALLGMLLASKFYVFLALGLSVPWSRVDADRLLRALPYVGLIFILVGAVGFLHPSIYADYFAAAEGDTTYERGGRTAFSMPFVHPGLYGWSSAVVLLGALALVIERRSINAVWGIVAGLAGILLSLRRRPLLGVPVAIASALWRLSGRQLAWLVGVAFCALVASALYARPILDAVFEDTLSTYLDPTAREGTARAAVTGGAFILARRHLPLGAGFGTYGGYAAERYYSPLYDELGLSSLYGLSPESPHYLQDTYWPHLLGETGVLGAFAMALFIITLIRRLGRARAHAAAGSPERTITLFASLVLVEGLVESLAGPVFEYSLQALTLAIAAAMALRLASQPSSTSAVARQ